MYYYFLIRISKLFNNKVFKFIGVYLYFSRYRFFLVGWIGLFLDFIRSWVLICLEKL